MLILAEAHRCNHGMGGHVSIHCTMHVIDKDSCRSCVQKSTMHKSTRQGIMHA